MHSSSMGSSICFTSHPSDCAAARAEQLLEKLLTFEGIIGCYIADNEGTAGLQKLPGLIRQMPFFRQSKQVLRSHSVADPLLERSTVRVVVAGGVLFFRRIETLYLCALALSGQDSASIVKALRLVANEMPGGFKMAPSIVPPALLSASPPPMYQGL